MFSTLALQVPRCRDGSIAAFVAKHGHGVYPSPGRVYRHFYLGNDLCSSHGPVWRPRRVVLLPPLQLQHDDAGDSPAAISELLGFCWQCFVRLGVCGDRGV